MFKLKFIKSKIFLVVIGVLVSVIFYYINYFSILFGKNETLPVEIICMVTSNYNISDMFIRIN